MLAQQSIVLATNNLGKIREIHALLDTRQIIPQSDYNVIECEETGTTFLENAILKARNASLQSGLPAIADDSGLIVDALQGCPGVKSARYAGPSASDQDNISKLLAELALVPDEQRDAKFVCVMVFMKHADDPCPVIAQGVWQGKILDYQIGANGFGYDPVFWLPDHQCTAAELTLAVKNSLSHRGQALRQLTSLLKADAS